MKQPIQPVETDRKGVQRFKKNAIVEFLIDKGPFDMNQLACIPFSNEDRQQFAQLIGYSISGYSDLSYVDDIAYGTVMTMLEENIPEVQARIEYLEQEIKDLRAALREPIARLFGIHPDDLQGE